MVELLGVTEDAAGDDADAVLQGTHMQLLAVDRCRQAQPKGEAAIGPRHLRALREVLLHRQLERREVLAVLLADVPQVAVVTTVFQVGSHAHLGDAAGRVGAESLQALDGLLVFAGNHPTDACPRRQGFREA